ncbi:telomeric repeat-binding factor 1 [Seriola lalandi dorsalis]|uniref:Telomeric repeat-binding factor n=1 Tax=Seriola lalandi dorsalis TaxID=1841481 RepID=A0A3B4WY08_SERLL|nr:telomeric repeat-binding factor 1 [Seriola lalandi dorsalis]XP_056220377.1 telomeric repeat-binding factor 1 [Seriola aureovittata]XP_056220378.1 telomeric repeat-binding factor 1 [Seriola aureovittata]
MDPEVNNKTAIDADKIDQSISFPHVTAVASGWMLDFMFVSLCRRFKEDKFDEFNETLSVFEAVSQNLSLKGDCYDEKILITAFLARVMHGKQLDIMFEEDECVMPLMSAAKIWLQLEDTVEDESVFKNIKILLLVQSVAVCLEKGQRSSASSALKWLESNHDLPQNVGLKLTTIVKQRDTYHPFLMSFSFSRLLETIHSFLDAYLEKNPSDFLLKAATKIVLSSQTTEGLKDAVTQESALSEKTNESTEKKPKAKRKLLSTKITDVWKPDSCKKAYVSLRRLHKSEISQIICEKSNSTTEIRKKRKPPQKWTPELDKYLKAGVKHHGTGKWSLILLDYDFGGRTGTMLKDRWRVLMRAHEVG